MATECHVYTVPTIILKRIQLFAITRVIQYNIIHTSYWPRWRTPSVDDDRGTILIRSGCTDALRAHSQNSHYHIMKWPGIICVIQYYNMSSISIVATFRLHSVQYNNCSYEIRIRKPARSTVPIIYACIISLTSHPLFMNFNPKRDSRCHSLFVHRAHHWSVCVYT